jgi:hypothetical protein
MFYFQVNICLYFHMFIYVAVQLFFNSLVSIIVMLYAGMLLKTSQVICFYVQD